MTSLAIKHPVFPAHRQPMRAAESPAERAERLTRGKISQSAKQLVADALIMPILSQFRESLQQDGVFGVSDAEKRLGPVIDSRVADAIVRRSRLPIVDRVEQSMLKRVGLSAKGITR